MLHDGIPNLSKYTFGLDPLLDSVDHPNPPRPEPADIPGETEPYPTLIFTLPNPLPGGVDLARIASAERRSPVLPAIRGARIRRGTLIERG